MSWLRSFLTLGALGLTVIAVPAQQEAEILIRGGEIVTAEGRRPADVRVVGATIAEVGIGLAARDTDTLEIDACGLLVLPGGIDPMCTQARGTTTRPRPLRHSPAALRRSLISSACVLERRRRRRLSALSHASVASRSPM